MKLATKTTYAISLLLALISSGAPLLAATFGRPVIIGGQAADLALDEGRGVLYIANFTGNRIEVMSTDTGVIQTSINVSPQPGSIALSPDRRWLLVAHFGNFATPNAPRNSLTLINLETNQRQIFSLTATPLSVAFGADGIALVATSNAFLIFDPVTGLTTTLSSITELALKTLPVPFNNYPQNVVASTSVTTRDHTRIYGVLQRSSSDSDVLIYRYDVGRLLLTGGRVSTPSLGPRTISTDANGANILVGWALLNENFVNVSQFPNASGTLNIGGHVIDSARRLIYAQLNEASGTSTTGSGSGTGTGTGTLSSIDQPKVLQILDVDNLTVRERVQLPENLSGKAILSANGNTM
ncbi:MAG: YncE family protein [Acidobacteriota bacterium]